MFSVRDIVEAGRDLALCEVLCPVFPILFPILEVCTVRPSVMVIHASSRSHVMIVFFRPCTIAMTASLVREN